MELLSEEEIAARIAQLEGGIQPAPPADWRWFKPLEDAADEWVAWAQHPERRVYTGIKELDAAMRGTAPGECTIIVGFAHSGKTVVTTQMILQNRDKRIAMFTPDETRVMVLVKLCSMVHGISALELERRVGMHDADTERLIRETANEMFPTLAVFDQAMTTSQMDAALEECEEYWGGPADAVVYDYVDLLEGMDTVGKINALKAWGRKHDVPMFLLHQSSRTKGSSGGKVTIDSGGYGGEQQATHMIGVRRKKSQITARIEELEEKIRTSHSPRQEWATHLEDARADLRRHQGTLTLSIVKNKRMPCTLIDDLDFQLDENTGRISPIYVSFPASYEQDEIDYEAF